jgi:hypothetical protein
VLGDLAVANGQYDAACSFYSEIANAPWPAYELRASVLEGRLLQAQKKYAQALEKYDGVIAAINKGSGTEEQRQLATLGKMAVLVATNKYPEKAQAPIAELHVIGQSLVYVDACCWEFDVAQFSGAPTILDFGLRYELTMMDPSTRLSFEPDHFAPSKPAC